MSSTVKELHGNCYYCQRVGSVALTARLVAGSQHSSHTLVVDEYTSTWSPTFQLRTQHPILPPDKDAVVPSLLRDILALYQPLSRRQRALHEGTNASNTSIES